MTQKQHYSMADNSAGPMLRWTDVHRAFSADDGNFPCPTLKASQQASWSYEA